MRKRFSAILLAAGLSAAMLSGTALAAGAAGGSGSEALMSQTEASLAAGAETEQESEAVPAASTQTEAENLLQPTKVTGDGKYTQYYAQLEQQLEQLLTQYSQLTDEQIQAAIKNGGASSVIAATWDGVKDDLGAFDGIESYDVDEKDGILTYTLEAKYAEAEKVGTKVTVTYVFDTAGKADEKCTWNVRETLGRAIGKAGLNTLIGLGTVFIVLIFLTYLIGQIHWIPDLLTRKQKEQEAASAATPVETASAEPVEEEVDDLELAAVISAAIAASQNAPADGFVVRSIRRRGRKSSWQKA